MDEERGKKPIAIGRFDVRRIQLIYCDCTFSTFSGLQKFVTPAMICLSQSVYM